MLLPTVSGQLRVSGDRRAQGPCSGRTEKGGGRGPEKDTEFRIKMETRDSVRTLLAALPSRLPSSPSDPE